MRRKHTLLFVTLLLLLNLLIPPQIFAGSINLEKDEKVVLISDENNGRVNVYADEQGTTLLDSLEDKTIVQLLEKVNDEYSLIAYENEEAEKLNVYVLNDTVYSLTEAEQMIEDTQATAEDEIDSSNDQEEAKDESTESELEDENSLDDKVDKEIDSKVEQSEAEQDKHVTLAKDEEESDLPKAVKAATQKASASVKGVALKRATHVYESKSLQSKVLKSYNQGHILIFNTNDSNWFSATVYLNGKPHTGFISKNDVDVIFTKEQEELSGDALIQNVAVYANPTKGSAVLKSYPKGRTLQFRSFSSLWHEATVHINGKRVTGYIFAQDVGGNVETQSIQSGTALKSPTVVYEKRNRNSKALKSYKYGHTLKFKYYNQNWYSATVHVNGKKYNGFIHIDDVAVVSLESEKKTLQGIGAKIPTNVYSAQSTSSSVLKSYEQGRLLKYQEFSDEWYEATVFVKGVEKTGYIHKNDVTDPNSNISGIAIKKMTHVYSATSTVAPVLKSYPAGSRLSYKPFNADWFIATVFVNGIKYTGYINKNDIGNTVPPSVLTKTIVLDAGHGGSDPGASGQGITEKSLTLELAKMLERQLTGLGFNVIMTRSTDDFISLLDRSKISNNANADMFLSIHGNSFNGSAKGIETFWYDKYSSESSRKLATAIQEEVIKSTNTPANENRGVKKGNFSVIRETIAPSALLEVGFIDNASDAAKLKQTSYKNSLVSGIVNGIKAFFN